MDKYYEEIGAQISYLCNFFNEIEIGENKVLENHPIINMSEPILLNPNSYKNIHHILKQLKFFCENWHRQRMGVYRLQWATFLFSFTNCGIKF